MKSRLVKYLELQIEQNKIELDDPERASNQLLGLLKANYFSEALIGIEPPSRADIRAHVDDSVDFSLKRLTVEQTLN